MIASQMGIYRFTNIKNGKVYVGSSLNIKKRRLEHLRRLKLGNHINSHFQYAFNKYKAKSFVFDIIELVDNEDDLIPRESYWVQKLNSLDASRGYNQCSPVQGGEVNQEFKQKVEGERNGRAKLKAADIPVICQRLNAGETTWEIAKTYDVKYQMIRDIMLGKKWRDLAEVYLSDDILEKWEEKAGERGIHPDEVSSDMLKPICLWINKGYTDNYIAKQFEMSEAGISCIRKGGCRSSETINLLSDDILRLWPYNIHLVKHLSSGKKKNTRTTNRSMEDKSNGNQKITNEQVIEICQLLNDGVSVPDIAKKYNMTKASIYSLKNGKSHRKITELHLNESFVANFIHHPKRNAKHRITSKEEVINVCKMLNDGVSRSDIASKLNISTSTVRGICNGDTHKEISMIHLNSDIIANWKV